jgi:hypothetical protein
VDFCEIWQAGTATQGYLNVTFFNLVASAIPKCWMFTFLRWAQLLNRLVDLDECLYGGDGIEYYLDYILFKGAGLAQAV